MPMKRSFTLVEIMIVVAIIALLAVIAIPNLLGARRNAAETYAKSVLRTISNALESYVLRDGGGIYPSINFGGTMRILVDAKYLNEDYPTKCAAPHPCYGYNFWCSSSSTNYFCAATSSEQMLNAEARDFKIETGGVMWRWQGSAWVPE